MRDVRIVDCLARLDVPRADDPLERVAGVVEAAKLLEKLRHSIKKCDAGKL
jgi:hypothetical protein